MKATGALRCLNEGFSALGTRLEPMASGCYAEWIRESELVIPW